MYYGRAPFKLNGVYATKVDPEEEIEDYKPSGMFKSAWNFMVTGNRETFEDLYFLLWFVENTYGDSGEKFKVGTGLYVDDILGTVESLNRYANSNPREITYDKDSFSFSENEVKYTGTVYPNNSIFLTTSKKSKDYSKSYQLRFIQV